MSRGRILIVDDDALIRETLTDHFGATGHHVQAAASAEEALTCIGTLRPQVVITDIRLPGMDGIDLLSLLRERADATRVLVMTAFEDMNTAIATMKGGAFDYLVKPLDLDELDAAVERCISEAAGAAAPDADAAGEGHLVGRDPRMIAIYKQIGAVARTRTPVLIRGETGTGKELIARAIHAHSATSKQPFIAVNCAALAETLLESELFGHVRGAFTGAIQDRAGAFETAGAGTLFLDEIGDISPGFQAKLLRVLQEGEYQPVGGDRVQRTNARVVAATHRPLEALIASGQFREDLYFRLRVVELVLPPLRARRADIPLLANHLLAKLSRSMHRDGAHLTASAVRALEKYDWPGNVRELENTVARALALAPGAVIREDDLRFGVQGFASATGNEAARTDRSLDTAERRHVEQVLREFGGNKRRAAQALGISRPRLDRLIEKHGLGNEP